MRRLSISRRTLFSLGAVALVATASALIALAQDDAPQTTQPWSGTITYTIEYGDVLDVIGASFDVSVRCIIEDNEIENPAGLFPGDTITINSDCPLYDGLAPVPNPRGARPITPSPSGQGGGADDGNDDGFTRAPAGAGETTVIVEQGDILDIFAAQYNVQLRCLIDRNFAPDDSRLLIRPGDAIVIPGNCPPYDGMTFLPTVNRPAQNDAPATAVPTASPTIDMSATPNPSPTPTQPVQPTRMVQTAVAPTQPSGDAPTAESLVTVTRPPTVTPTPEG